MARQKSLARAIRQNAVAYLHARGIEDAGALLEDAAHLGKNHQDIEAFHRRHFIKPDGSIDLNKQAAFARAHTIERTVTTYMPVIEKLSAEQDKGALAGELDIHIQALQQSGMPLDEVVLAFNKLMKIAPALTPHPTENLAPEAISLLQNLLNAALVPPKKRRKALEGAIADLFDAPVFGAVRKASVLDEARQARVYKLEHIKAINAFDRRLEDALESAYGTRPKISTNTALRNWDKDTDGKDNAEGFAMIAGLAMDQVDALNLALSTLEDALENPACPQNLRDLAGKYTALRAELEPIAHSAGRIVEVLALLPPEERAMAYPKLYEKSYEDLRSRLTGAYETLGDPLRGLNLYRESVKVLGSERENAAFSKEQKRTVDEAFRTIQKHGFCLSKSQTRISYNIYMRLLDNLLMADPAPDVLKKILTDEELDDIRAAGGFSGIADEEQQRGLLNEMYHNIQRLNLEEAFYAALRTANPMTPAASGFPVQTYSVCDVLDIRTIFPLMYEEGIISDGGPCSFEIQKLMGLVSGNPLMKNMPLFETLDTYMQASVLSEKFMALDAGESGAIRLSRIPAGVGTGYKGYSLIVPASDSAKEGGDGAKLVGGIGERALFRHTIKRGETVQQMNGAGISLNRSIGHPAIIRRMGAQELMVHALERGRPMSLSDPQDIEMMRMAMTIMYTEQGRGNRLNALTSTQILNTLSAHVIEITQDILELTGKVPAHTFIDKPVPLTAPQRRAFETLPRNKMRRHFIMRHAALAGGEDKILDRIADTARGAHMAPFTNIMSRAAAKTKKAGMTSERAIGNDISQSSAELFFSGFYGTGTALGEHFEKIGQGSESLEDLKAVLFHPEMVHALVIPGLINAGRVNADYLFHSLSPQHNRKLKDVLAVGRAALFVKNPESGKHEIRYPSAPGGFSPEEAYLAKIIYDRTLLLALTEEVLSAIAGKRPLNTDVADVLSRFTKGTKGLDVGPGPRSLGKWKEIGSILEEHAYNAPGLALWRGMNASLNNPALPRPEDGYLMSIAAAFRAGTLPHWPYWQEAGPGAHNRKRVKNVLELVAGQKSQAPVRLETGL